jgi:hypothetical protein
MAKEEARVAIQDLLKGSDKSIVSISIPQKIFSIVEYSGHTIYKSTVVSQLNGCLFLFKDRLTCKKNSIIIIIVMTMHLLLNLQTLICLVWGRIVLRILLSEVLWPCPLLYR